MLTRALACMVLTIALLSAPAAFPQDKSIQTTEKKVVTLPILVRGSCIYVVASVGPSHQKVTMLIDTGASQTVLNMKYVPNHNGVAPQTQSIVTGGAIKQVLSLPTDIYFMDYDGSSGLNTTPNVWFLNQNFGPAEGLLGADVLTQFDRVTFDMKAGVLILEKM